LFTILFQVASAVKEIKTDNKEKSFTSTSIHLLIAVFMSIILSVAIALNAEIPASSGHGGFINIIGPGIYGLIVLVLYLVFLRIWPEWKFLFGLVCIITNISIGFYFMLTDF